MRLRLPVLALALVWAGAGTVAAQSVSTTSKKLFDGSTAHSGTASASPASPWGALGKLQGSDGTLNLCDPALLGSRAVPRELFAADSRFACRADGEGAPASFVKLTVPGESGGAFAGRGLRALLEDTALRDAAFRDMTRRYYERVRLAPAPPAPGWAWKLALAEAGGDASLAMRLSAFCGHDDAEPGELRSPRSPSETRLARESEDERLVRRLGSRAGAAPSDPLAWSAENLAANDLAADRDRRAALQGDDLSESREGICPAPGAAFYRSDGLGAGVPASAEHRRVYTGAALACEALRAGNSAGFARNAPPNSAWVDRLLRITRETAEGGRSSDGGPLGELAPARADALGLLALWDPEQGFPAGKPPTRPQAWSLARYTAALKALRALGKEWKAGVAEHAAGAAFGVRVCARGK